MKDFSQKLVKLYSRETNLIVFKISFLYILSRLKSPGFDPFGANLTNLGPILKSQEEIVTSISKLQITLSTLSFFLELNHRRGNKMNPWLQMLENCTNGVNDAICALGVNCPFFFKEYIRVISGFCFFLFFFSDIGLNVTDIRVEC